MSPVFCLFLGGIFYHNTSLKCEQSAAIDTRAQQKADEQN